MIFREETLLKCDLGENKYHAIFPRIVSKEYKFFIGIMEIESTIVIYCLSGLREGNTPKCEANKTRSRKIARFNYSFRINLTRLCACASFLLMIPHLVG